MKSWRLWHTVSTRLPTAVCWMLFCAATVTAAPTTEEILLDTVRWREHSHGLSLRPPLGSRRLSQTADDALVRFYGAGGDVIRLYIKKSNVELTLNDLIPEAIHQLGGVYPSARILTQKQLEQGGRPGAVIYFRIPNSKNRPWVLGQAYTQLTPHQFAMLQLEVDLDQLDTIQPVFEAVFRSLEVQDPKQIDRLRQTQVAQGQAWLSTFNTQRIDESIRPEQWFRIVDRQQKDIGYMHVQQQTKAHMGYTGVQVKIRSKIVLNGTTHNSISHFFASDDGQHEFWSTRTTTRRESAVATKSKRHPATANTQSWAETGVRSKDNITVSFERPSGIQKRHWQRPPEGYLSQAYVHLLEQWLGPNDKPEMGFYSYHASVQKLLYRTARVESAPNGSYVIYTRPNPQQDEQASHYNARGELEKRVVPGGQTVLPTTKHQLASKWTTIR